ncbi:hypothetical protein [Lacinutrix undariae]
MNKIPNKIKYGIFGISTLIFLLFFLGIINPFGLNDSLQNITGYFFGLSFSNIDYLTISSIPVFGMFFNSSRNEFKIADLIKDILTILICTLITIAIGLYLLTFIGKPNNPLIPQYLLREPFFLYSTLTIAIGILIPFLIIKRNKKRNGLNNNGIENG